MIDQPGDQPRSCLLCKGGLPEPDPDLPDDNLCGDCYQSIVEPLLD